MYRITTPKLIRKTRSKEQKKQIERAKKDIAFFQLMIKDLCLFYGNTHLNDTEKHYKQNKPFMLNHFKMCFISHLPKKVHLQMMPLINIDRTLIVFHDKSNFALFSMNSKYLERMRLSKSTKAN